jgi:hypothetical protein
MKENRNTSRMNTESKIGDNTTRTREEEIRPLPCSMKNMELRFNPALYLIILLFAAQGLIGLSFEVLVRATGLLAHQFMAALVILVSFTSVLGSIIFLTKFMNKWFVYFYTPPLAQASNDKVDPRVVQHGHWQNICRIKTSQKKHNMKKLDSFSSESDSDSSCEISHDTSTEALMAVIIKPSPPRWSSESKS